MLISLMKIVALSIPTARQCLDEDCNCYKDRKVYLYDDDHCAYGGIPAFYPMNRDFGG